MSINASTLSFSFVGLLVWILNTADILNATDTRPNILLLLPDQWRFDWADQHFIDNLSINAPNVESIFTQGTRFTNVVVGSPLCAPSRSCMASGREYDLTGVPSNTYDYPPNQTTFYQLIRDNGYHVMVSGKDDLTKKTGCGATGTYRSNELGFSDQARCQGKDDVLRNGKPHDPYGIWLNASYIGTINESFWDVHYSCFKTDCCPKYTGHECPNAEMLPDYGYQDNYVQTVTIELFERKPLNQPWFLQVNYAGPHPPFAITPSMNTSVKNRIYDAPVESNVPMADNLIIRRDYMAEIENLDDNFGGILDLLKAYNEYDNTIICISSDHGEMLGDYSLWSKQYPWSGALSVPLACMGPNIIANRTINTPVTNMDLAGTFLDYSETKIPSNETDVITTRSLRNMLQGNETSNRDYVLSGFNRGNTALSTNDGSWRLVIEQVNVTTTWKYLCCYTACPGRSFDTQIGNFTHALFNMTDDFYDRYNLAASFVEVTKTLQKLLPIGYCQDY